LVIAPPLPKEYDPEQIDKMLRGALKDHPTKKAAEIVAERTGQSRSQIYNRALELKS